MAEPIRALVVDDEPLGRKRLEGALASHSDVEVIGTAADGEAGWRSNVSVARLCSSILTP